MRDFSFNGVSLSSFGGRILQAPSHTIAKRNISREKIYGQSGDEIIDNGSYDNVDFSLKIGFMPFLTNQSARSLADAVVYWLASLQNGYYEYTDTLKPGYYTRAVLTNFGEIVQELPTLLTGTLKFSRVPFWYRNDGKNVISLSSDNVIANPEAYSAEPLYCFVYSRNGFETISITVNGETVNVDASGKPANYYFDNVQKQFYWFEDDVKSYLGRELLPDLQPGENNISFRVGPMSIGSFRLDITPNWRRL